MRVRCSNCGLWLEISGRAATCPSCGSLVTIPVAPPPPPARAVKEERGVRYEPAPHYEPPKPPIELPEWLRAIVVIGVLGLVVFGAIFFTIWKLTSKSPVATPAPAQAAPNPTPNASKNDAKGSKLFSFDASNTRSEPPPIPAESATDTSGVLPDQRPASPATTTPVTAPRLFPRVAVSATPPAEVTDEAINAAILKGAEHLISRYENGRLKGDLGDRTVGTNALCLLALLHAGQAVTDERLDIHNPFTIAALEQLRKMELPQTLLTYTRSLRAQALAVYNRREDRSVLEADTRYLLTSGVKGAYAYVAPSTPTTQPDQIGWDNSNSQYGALGVWAAAEAGVPVAVSYWQDVQSHWERTQGKSGGWDYREGGAGTLSMTAAGVNMLFVANEMISALRPDVQIARPPFSPALQAGLDWMSTGDHAINVGGGGFATYTLYGLERAGLACGFKMFGAHDWFRVLAANALKAQQPNGSFGDEVDTAFTLLFLSRGRHPLLMNKLHFVGAWANRPRDVARLAKFVSRETERPLNWQVVSLRGQWTDWMDAPILYLASHEAPIFDESDFEKIKSFVRAGGLLFTQADGDSKEFNQFAELLAMKIFDGEELKDLPADHLINKALFRPEPKIPLRAVSNATRVLMLHSPTDIAKRWQARDTKSDRAAFEAGANLFVYATGMSVPRNRLDTLAIAEPAGKPTVTIPIARLKHGGNWDPEPWAWERESRLLRQATGVGLAAEPVEIAKLSTAVAPIAHLTATATVSLSDAEIEAIQKYVEAGGVLLIEPCGGAPALAQNLRDNVLARAFPGKQPAALKADHALVAGRGDGMTELAKPQARPFVFGVMGQKFTHPLILESGRGAVIISDLDLTSGLLGTNTLGIVGYEPGYAQKFVSNLVLWTINGRGGAPVWAEKPVEPRSVESHQ